MVTHSATVRCAVLPAVISETVDSAALLPMRPAGTLAGRSARVRLDGLAVHVANPWSFCLKCDYREDMKQHALTEHS